MSHTMSTRRCAGSWKVALAAAIVLALAGACFIAPPAFAETIKKQWTVEFTGDKMEGNGSASLLQAVNGMQPGDSAEFTIDLYESSDKAADWYMRNEVLKSMEESFDDANSNSGGSYSYRLVYISPQNEEKVILTNEVVSGDKGAGDTEGLFDATESTGEWFYLDTLAPEALAKVILTVGIDGETHGNSYFDTSAKIQSSFAAEPTDEPGTPGQATQPDPDTPKKDNPTSDQPKNPANQTEKAKGKLSQTGDMIPLTIIAVVAIAAGILVVVVAMRNRRESREDEEGDAR